MKQLTSFKRVRQQAKLFIVNTLRECMSKTVGNAEVKKKKQLAEARRFGEIMSVQGTRTFP